MKVVMDVPDAKEIDSYSYIKKKKIFLGHFSYSIKNP